MSNQKILILAAVPARLRIDQEIREIEEAIKRAVKRDSFEIKIRTAVRPKDIRRALEEEKPQIVHFCGHGEQDGSLRLEDDGGNNQLVSPESLASLFNLHTGYVNCVLLNACYSSKPAEAISKHINYVIGMNQPIEDRAAIVFAQGFYDGLGYDNINNLDVIQRAFDEGIVAIQLENLLQGTIPSIWKLGIAQIKLKNRNDDESSNRNEQEAQKLQANLSSIVESGGKSKAPTTTTTNFFKRIFQLARRSIQQRKILVISAAFVVVFVLIAYGTTLDDLSSEKGVDYTQLLDLLKAGQWKDADNETSLVMLKVLGRKDGERITKDELLNFPCTDLRTIDKLWVKYSNGRFGFSVQKKIYLEVGGKPDRKYDVDAWNQFGDRVGWIVNRGTYPQGIPITHLRFTTDAPRGHLPVMPTAPFAGWGFSFLGGGC